jgi:hypothetical protein
MVQVPDFVFTKQLTARTVTAILSLPHVQDLLPTRKGWLQLLE